MPEQPQWPERTLDMPPQDPWAEPPTTDMAQRPASHQGGPRGPQQNRPGGHQETRVWGAPEPSSGTAPFPQGAPPPQQEQPPPSPFTSGRASVNPRPRPQEPAAGHEPTGTGWPGAEAPREQRPLAWHVEQLRRGGEWSFAGLLFAFVCWGIWAISSGGDLTTPIIVFLVSVLVAAGVFALSRLIGRLVWERQLGRERHTAKGSHIVAGVFLVGVGIAHLQQTEWVMTAFNWVADLFR